ncbi:hypothetical protein GF312_10505 [Candidatus Poribacteria bacterium]|nr:hypothetical protein [Candidatus Poribacteria bacterium]
MKNNNKYIMTWEDNKYTPMFFQEEVMPGPAALDFVPQKVDFRNINEWLRLFNNPDQDFSKRLVELYGNNKDFIDTRRSLIIRALEHFAQVYGPDKDVTITRAPGRINLRGMHSEMQHATPNYLTHGREIVMVVGRRDNDKVVLNNVDNERFGPREFTISRETKQDSWGEWTKYIDSEYVRKSIETARGDWANYVKASVLKIQDSFPDKALKGMDVVTYGDAPRGSGMASSSAVVVSSALAFMAVNNLEMDRREFTVELGRGEWYVGTRGGFGDHGAILFGKQGSIIHSVFLTVEEMQPEYIPLPDDYQVIIVKSYKTSSKSDERLFAYNQTMFAYSMATTLIKDVLAGMEGIGSNTIEKLEYLGQITPQEFGLQKIYEMLLALPEQISIKELRSRYSDAEIDSRLDRFFGQLKRFPDSVEVRGATLWGIAESERSREFGRLIKEGRIKEAGELMFIGHDGDRLFKFGQDLQSYEQFTQNKVTNPYLENLIANINSSDEELIKKSQLARQPGDYDASSLELDTIVEIARRTEGVIGASLTGAGFGGNVLVMAEKNDECLSRLKNALIENYYEPNEAKELDWLKYDNGLEKAIEDKNDLEQMRSRLADIVKKKRRKKEPVNKAEAEYLEAVQRKVNALFKDKKIDRELLFIPADYYFEGLAVNIPVERACML